MTQEELDALMAGATDDIDELDDVAEEASAEQEATALAIEETVEAEAEEKSDDGTPSGYTEDTSHQWPLPATDENKMVHQLDDVTKESE